MASEIRVNKINNRAGLGTITIADTGVVVNGIVTCTEVSGLNVLNIAGVSTFASTLDINGDIDVDGHTNLDNLSVAGVSTFSNNITLNGGLVASSSVTAGQILVGSGVTIESNQVATGQATFTGIVTASAFKLPDGSNAGNDLTSVTTNIVPDNDSSRELGQETKAWQRLWSDEVRILGNGRVQFVGAYMGMVSANGHLLIKNNESKEIQLHSKFGSGILIAENTGHLMPTTDSAINIGSNTIRFQNVYADTYYGDGANLTNLPAGAPVGGASTNTVFFENDKEVAVNYQITSTKNAMTAGPVAINAGIAVTVPSGCAWTIV